MKRIILYTFGAILLATALVSCEKELMNYSKCTLGTEKQ